MSSKTRIVAFALAFAFMAGFAFSAQADVTGSFETHISVDLPDETTNPTEVEVLEFDVQNAIDLSVVISGLSTTLHSHFGLAGVEDVQLGYAATLGALDINGTFVFGRFSGACNLPFRQNCFLGVSNNPNPLTDDLLFIKKRVKTSISLGGVSFENLAMFEDVNFPESSNRTTPYQTSDQEFAFGDVITLSGQTPSGVSISASTGICAERSPNVIKKHWWPYEVNSVCAPGNTDSNTTTKPDLMFDFETLNISGIPIASGITGSADIACVRTTKCSMTHSLDFSGAGPIPFTVAVDFEDLFTLELDSVTLTFSTGAGTLDLEFDSTGQLGAAEVDLSTTLNPDTNPANFSVNVEIEPGTGITNTDLDPEAAAVGLSITRSNVDFSINALFTGSGGDTAEFDSVSFSVGTAVGPVDVSTSANFGRFGFNGGSTTFTISF